MIRMDCMEIRAKVRKIYENQVFLIIFAIFRKCFWFFHFIYFSFTWTEKKVHTVLDSPFDSVFNDVLYTV